MCVCVCVYAHTSTFKPAPVSDNVFLFVLFCLRTRYNLEDHLPTLHAVHPLKVSVSLLFLPSHQGLPSQSAPYIISLTFARHSIDFQKLNA